MSITDREFAELLRSNPELGFEGDLIAATDSRPQSSTNAAYIQESITCEHDLQCAVIAECDRRAVHDDRYGMIYAIPNGGGRSKAEGGRLKAEGVRAGVPDLFLPVPVGMHHGLYIELKWGAGKPRPAQLEWARRLRLRGYRVEFVWDSVAAVLRVIEDYLGEP